MFPQKRKYTTANTKIITATLSYAAENPKCKLRTLERIGPRHSPNPNAELNMPELISVIYCTCSLLAFGYLASVASIISGSKGIIIIGKPNPSRHRPTKTIIGLSSGRYKSFDAPINSSPIHTLIIPSKMTPLLGKYSVYKLMNGALRTNIMVGMAK